MDYEALTNDIVSWVKEWYSIYGADKKAVIGISGGAKSYITTALMIRALGKSAIIGVLMRDDKDKAKDNDGKDVCDHFDIEYYILPVFPAVNAIKNVINLDCKIKISELAVRNLPARIRMASLYAIAQSKNGFVINTNCLSDYYIGNTTLWGDAVGDISPFGNITLTEMRHIGIELGVSEKYLYMEPYDHLPASEPDEDKFGIKYTVLDEYIRTGKVLSLPMQNKIDTLAVRSLFKKNPVCSFDPSLPIFFRNEQ